MLVSEFDSECLQDDHWKILAYILELEEEYTTKKIELIQHPEFDLELVYERHGKKF